MLDHVLKCKTTDRAVLHAGQFTAFSSILDGEMGENIEVNGTSRK